MSKLQQPGGISIEQSTHRALLYPVSVKHHQLRSLDLVGQLTTSAKKSEEIFASSISKPSPLELNSCPRSDIYRANKRGLKEQPCLTPLDRKISLVRRPPTDVVMQSSL